MEESALYWNGWEPIIRILIVGSLTYTGIVLILRVSGKRTLASMNAFDFIVTVAMGAVFGRVLTAKSVSVSEAITAFLLLVVLQLIFSFLETRSRTFHKLITNKPTLMYYNGQYYEQNMQKERVVKSDLLGQVRKKSIGSINDVEVIILETDGSFSVIKKNDHKAEYSYEDIIEK